MNMPSVEEHPEVVAAYLEEELAQAWLVVLEAGTAESLGMYSHQPLWGHSQKS